MTPQKLLQVPQRQFHSIHKKYSHVPVEEAKEIQQKT
jgi:hypothetical protein